MNNEFHTWFNETQLPNYEGNKSLQNATMGIMERAWEAAENNGSKMNFDDWFSVEQTNYKDGSKSMVVLVREIMRIAWLACIEKCQNKMS